MKTTHSGEDLRRSVSEHTWSAEIRAAFALGAPQHWKTDLSQFVGVPNFDHVFEALTVLAASAVCSTNRSLRMAIEILLGPGQLDHRLAEFVAHEWDFEVEDCLACARVWRVKEHAFQADAATWDNIHHNVIPALRKRVEPSWSSPEEPPASADESWIKALRKEVQAYPDPLARAAGEAAAKTPACTPDQAKGLRAVFRETDMQQLSNNSVWTRLVGAHVQPTVAWKLPHLEEYSKVGIRAYAINTHKAHILREAFQGMLLDQLKGEGDQRDLEPDRIAVVVERFMPGPTSATKCLNGVMTSSGGHARLEVTWCKNLRRLLHGDITMEIEGMAVGWCLDLPPDYHMELLPSSTAPYLQACKARGMDERAALYSLARALLTQLPEVAAVYVQPCNFLPGGKGPGKFWDWWAHGAQVRVGFLTEDEVRRVRADPRKLFIFNGPAMCDSVLIMRVWFKSPPPAHVAGFSKITMAARAEREAHLLVTGWNVATWKGIHQRLGAGVLTVRGAQEAFLVIFRECGTLPDDAVECILSARGDWDLAQGMRIYYCDLATQQALVKFIREGLGPRPGVTLLLPNQPLGSLQVVIKNAKAWSNAAPSGAQVVAPQAGAPRLIKSVEVAAVKLANELELVGRVYLPPAGTELFSMPLQPYRDTVTLRALYTKLGIDAEVAHGLLATRVLTDFSDVIRQDDYPGDGCFLVNFRTEETSLPPRDGEGGSAAAVAAAAAPQPTGARGQQRAEEQREEQRRTSDDSRKDKRTREQAGGKNTGAAGANNSSPAEEGSGGQ